MSPSDSAFVHRYGKDGTIESICRSCFSRVGIARHEADLERPEVEHTCMDAAPAGGIPAPEPAQ